MNFGVLIACLIWNGNLVQSNKQEIIEDLKNIIFKIKKSGDDFGPGPTSIPAFTATLSKDFTP
ncbi:Hypothetical predicted protein [Mytilus galloprovincialis]|uniref:Uncharacterized protein n=1 Tax=Mytilus galloprovincialis TaxID=29158 RepID=A0A8B6H4N4_MYTGA|nr:Hypothetical predicted protein [Mytilus galloprovincialis]